MSRLPGLLALAMAGSGFLALPPGDGAYDFTLHGDADRGVFRRPGLERGDCGHCHVGHASVDGSAASPHQVLLFAENDDQLCFACHASAGAAMIFPGQAEAIKGAHASSSGFLWPGPDPARRPAADTGKCLNCHDPHGRRDANGVIPAMSVAREEVLCLTCHDATGPARDDIASELRRSHRHPILTVQDRHDVDEGSDPDTFKGPRRHAECSDCHNPHLAMEQMARRRPPLAGAALRGVPALQVSNGPAGTSPVYTWRDGMQFLQEPPAEYGVCFRCHSGWSDVPREDLGVLLNPNNPSYHPVEAAGSDPRIPDGAFVNGVDARTIILCSDCHRSADPLSPSGPHGSDERHILAGWYPDGTQERTMPDDALCFRCHSHSVYAADDRSEGSLQAMSRWNPPAFSSGHVFHVASKRIPCSACHAVHGSTLHPSLIQVGRRPGLTRFAQSQTGGTCGSTCHQDQGWDQVNYPR